MVIAVRFEGDTAIIEVSYDGDGAIVPGAWIEIRNPQGTVLVEGKTDERGRFVLPDLPGPVEVIAETADHRATRHLSESQRLRGGTGPRQRQVRDTVRDALLGLAVIFSVASFLALVSLRRRVTRMEQRNGSADRAR